LGKSILDFTRYTVNRLSSGVIIKSCGQQDKKSISFGKVI
jgi:hypothetical protein